MFKRIKRNKKGIEVTINFIVMLILAIVVLAGSMVLINKFFKSAQETKASIDSQTESQIKSMLIGGAKVAIPINRISAHRGDFVTFGVGILNVMRDENDYNDFIITAEDCTIPEAPPLEPTPKVPQSYPVKKNDQKIFLVGYNIPRDAERGAYICNIYVKEGEADYAEPVYKAYIVVE